MANELLRVEELSTSYGDLRALWGVSLEVRENEIVALLGGNGAGKSTSLRCIAGLHPVQSGTVLFEGRDLRAVKPHRRIREGLVLIPEERGIFPMMSVEENLKVGGFTIREKAGLETALAWVYGLFPVLRARRWQPAGSLSGGEQQMLSIGKGLVSQPKLLMLDELSLGLAPVLVLKLLDLLKEIHANGVTLVLVDQNVKKILSFCHRGYVFENGRIVLEGKAADLAADPRTRKAYLGR
ncbi:MAG: ABC transporter ATP-binding protein [Deltaproteobacteria bacterium]|nr:ABC transporter ATP-binding protein [Deltaproteobacteria bacterium]